MLSPSADHHERTGFWNTKQQNRWKDSCWPEYYLACYPGEYKLVPNSSPPVYRQSFGPNYLFSWRDGWHGWLVGPDTSQGVGGCFAFIKWQVWCWAHDSWLILRVTICLLHDIVKENLRNFVPYTTNHQFCCPGGLATASNAPCPHADLPWSFYDKDGGFTENPDIDVR